MKKMIIALTMAFMMISGSAMAEDITAKVERGMKSFFASNGLADLDVNIQLEEKLQEPKGLYLIKMVLMDKKTGRQQEQMVFTDGKYLFPDIIEIATNNSVKDTITFKKAEKVDLDLSKLTLIEGNPNAKHVIVTVSDFQCPYCKKAHAYIHGAIAHEKLDVATYMMHLPLNFHPKAKLYATIFEAGKEMGKNFSRELYATDKKFDAQTDEQIIELFAAKSGNAAKFKTLLKSPSIAGKIDAQSKMAASLGITGTPHVFFDGKPVGGFKQSLYDMGLDSFK